jgi:hypothetical protein
MAQAASPKGPGWSEALRRVTGYRTDLRALCDGNAMICPTLIIVQKDPHEGASLTMTNNYGEPAISRLVTELDQIAQLMPSLQAGQLGLMDVNLIRRASATMSRQETTLAGLHKYAQQLLSATKPSADGSDGEFRRNLANEIAGLERRVSAEFASLTRRQRSITKLIDDAAGALSAFGVRMAQVFTEAKPALVQMATSFWDGANANLAAYWRANGWGPGGSNSRLFATAPATAETLFDAAVAGYSSAGLPGLPAGTPTIVANLSDGWGAFGAALTQLLGRVLDSMDEEANDALAAVAKAYSALIVALGGKLPEEVGGPLFLRSVPPGEGMPAAPITLAEATPALPGIPAAGMLPGIPAQVGGLIPALPLSPTIPAEEGTPALDIPVGAATPAWPGTPAGEPLPGTPAGEPSPSTPVVPY